MVELVANGESETVEYKRRLPTHTDLARIVTSFANTKGGRLVVGVEDGGRIVGLDAEELDLDTVHRLLGLARSRIDPPVDVRAEHVSLDGKDLLVLHVPFGHQGPHAVVETGGATVYVRRGSTLAPASTDELRRLVVASSLGAFEDSPVPSATLADLDSAALRNYFSRRSLMGRSPEDTPFDALPAPVLLRNTGFATSSGPAVADLVPTVAALLLFSRDPTRYLPHARVELVRFTGPKPPDPDHPAGRRHGGQSSKGTAEIVAREDAGGTLLQQIERGIAFIQRHMRTGARVRGFSREDVPEYPLPAVRELLVNALVHRDYALSGLPTQVRMYADRWEFISPGRLPGPLTAELLARSAERYARNPRIAAAMSVLGAGEALGFGLPYVRTALRDAGLPVPKITDGPVSVTVTLFGSAGARARAEDVRRYRNELVHQGGNARQLQTLEHLTEHDTLTNATYRNLTGVSEMTALRDLTDLVERGVLERHGTKRGAYYTLAAGGPAGKRATGARASGGRTPDTRD